MEKLVYCTENSETELFIGKPWYEIGDHIDISNTIIITDSNIHSIYGDNFPSCPVITIDPGEQTKSITTVESIVEQLLEKGCDRTSFLLGIGGGVICDITGFVASVYMRGVNFGFISTTLLSQVDASTGGKNGVNSGVNKNIIGCINQPSFVICDPEMLKSLPEEEYISGLGELVKHAFIRDAGLLGFIEENIGSILNRDHNLLTTLISASVKIKIDIVTSDEKERGIRRLLNFGHTIGHAVEIELGMKHGFAVSYGMLMAAQISVEMGLLDRNELGRIETVLNKLKLLTDMPQELPDVTEAILKDKKVEKNKIFFVLLEGIGNGVIREIRTDDLVGIIKNKK